MRKLVTPKWLLLHALAIVAFAVCLRAGLWQWDRAKSHTGTFQNFGYALQWPLFAVFVVVLWWRMVRDTLHPEVRAAKDAAKDAEQAAMVGAAGPAAAVAVPETSTIDEAQPSPAVSPAPTRTPSAIPPVEELIADESDPEVAAYNRYLAWLYARDAAQERDRAARRTAVRGGRR